MDTDKLIVEPQCFCCAHLLEWPYCKAFPNGIPKEIRLGERNHNKPFPGDGGLQFKPMDRDKQ